MDIRRHTCPYCDGDGGSEGPICHIDYRDGSAWGDWYECNACDGTGEIEDDTDMYSRNWEDWQDFQDEAFAAL